ncbi:fluoride efflux transporter FluC [Gryllotalpicola ginsengisoli]|uniref:fluoride efflux transporter FluC n=1 Tax=Gryllotalpicola ginsengisoli TaxID=444608 RepID=UPI0003B30D1D|nr:CrcB family protein [Gryllotalpicola ginsengisoli]
MPEPRPLHLRPVPLLLVFAGGAVGSLCRYLLSLVLPEPFGLPLPTLAVNLVGAFALGLMLEGLLRGGPDAGWRRALRLGMGAGFLGGFTTYSSLAVETALLSNDARYFSAGGYAVLSLLAGVAAAAAGVWVAARLVGMPAGPAARSAGSAGRAGSAGQAVPGRDR